MIRRFYRNFGENKGLALAEFAIALPIILPIILWGLELANYAIVREQVSQLSEQVADNASRMGDQNILRNKPISEKEINDLLIGSNLQGGSLKVLERARIIVSSLETNSSNGQWLHWQRCYGYAVHQSSYGRQGDGTSGTNFPGMGPANSRITSSKNNPVMFVEMSYRYTPLISSAFSPAGDITEIAAMSVRDDRDTSQVYNPENVTPSNCS